jgi:hypothetical protein
MSLLSRRVHPRNFCETEVRYAPADENDFKESRAYNFSRGGMYLETPNWFPTNSNLRIVMKAYDPGTAGPEAYRSYVANVRWHRKLQRNDAPVYGIGVQFLEQHHAALEEPVQVEWVACDVCNNFVKRDESRLTEDRVRICQSCCSELGCLPDGKLRDTIERYLSGNIL